MSESNLRFLLRPRWIAFHLLVVSGAALMVSLGFWQLSRLDDRQAFNAVVTERIDQPPVPLASLLDEVGTDPASIEWRQVTVAGEYLPEQVVWFNRSQGGIAGDNVLTALVADDTTVVVNRGFVPLGSESPLPPTDEVEVLGRVRIPAGRQLGGLTDDTDAGPVTEVRRIDLGRLDQQIPGELAPIYLDLIGSVPNVTASDPVPVPPPTIDEGPHLSYAVQWFIFAAAVVLGWVLAVRRSVAARARRDEQMVTDAAVERTTPGSPTSVDAASTTTTR